MRIQSLKYSHIKKGQKEEQEDSNGTKGQKEGADDIKYFQEILKGFFPTMSKISEEMEKLPMRRPISVLLSQSGK